MCVSPRAPGGGLGWKVPLPPLSRPWIPACPAVPALPACPARPAGPALVLSARRPCGRGRRFLLRRRWLDSQDAAVLVIDQHVEKFVGALPDVADAHPQRPQQRLAAEFFQLFVDEHTFEMTRPRNLAGPLSADEDVALPFRQFVAGV